MARGQCPLPAPLLESKLDIRERQNLKINIFVDRKYKKKTNFPNVFQINSTLLRGASGAFARCFVAPMVLPLLLDGASSQSYQGACVGGGPANDGGNTLKNSW